MRRRRLDVHELLQEEVLDRARVGLAYPLDAGPFNRRRDTDTASSWSPTTTTAARCRARIRTSSSGSAGQPQIRRIGMAGDLSRLFGVTAADHGEVDDSPNMFARECVSPVKQTTPCRRPSKSSTATTKRSEPSAVHACDYGSYATQRKCSSSAQDTTLPTSPGEDENNVRLPPCY
jgi:hypothetical protein